MVWNRKFIFFLGLVALIFLVFKNFYLLKNQTPQSSLPVTKPLISSAVSSSPILSSASFIVTRVVDGDTIQIDTGQKVRYIGMNTPETVDPRRPVQCFGHEASAYNKNLVLNKKVKLVKDVSEKDKYGRLLRYVYLADGTFVNLKLVQDGYAYADTFPPDVAHADDFVKAQRQAREAKLGLWEKCN